MGSGHLHWQAYQRSLGVLEVAGSFVPNGASAIDNSLNVGQGFSVSRIGTGHYRVTLEPQINVVRLQPFVQFAANSLDGDFHGLVITENNVPGRRFSIRHISTGDTATSHPAPADVGPGLDVIAFLVKVWTTRTQGSGVP